MFSNNQDDRGRFRKNTPILYSRTNSPLPDVMFTEINTALDDSYGGTDTIKTVQEENSV